MQNSGRIKRLRKYGFITSCIFLISCGGEEQPDSQTEKPTIEKKETDTTNTTVEDTLPAESDADSMYYANVDHFSHLAEEEGVNDVIGCIIRNSGYKSESIYYYDLHEMLDSCQNGDSLFIRTGEYYLSESLELWEKKNIVVTGEGFCKLIAQNTDDNVMWIITCENIEVRNIQATHTAPAEDERCYGNVFALDMGENVTIRNCDINGCGAIGVYIFGTENITLENNYIHDNTLWGVQDDGHGMVYPEESDNVHFINNRWDNNGYLNPDLVIEDWSD